ncbi:MAG: carboxypeptidase regulatory-like domain-containing protein [Acidobacteria bacterium]|nr:carboxypeptidase regulatory-like domain-containing protein [Acidobacteriota bacterium]
MRRLLSVILVVATAAATVGSAADPPTGSVKLPLAEYLRLVRQAEHNREAARAVRREEEPSVAALATQSTDITIGEETARVRSTFVVEVTGAPERTVPLPVTGLASTIGIVPDRGAVVGRADAAQAKGGSGLVLIPRRPGRYTVSVTGAALLKRDGGRRLLTLAPALAPVAVTRIDLPDTLSWRCPGTVVASEQVADGRRKLELGIPPGSSPTFSVAATLTEDQSKDLFATVTTVTLLRVTATGVRRTDIALYDVQRGELATHRIELPEGFEPDRAATDEREVPPLPDGHTLRIRREESLDFEGWVAVSGAVHGESLDLSPIRPALPVTAHYLALSSEAAARLDLPDGAWVRIGLDDLPEELATVLRTLDTGAVWRRTGSSPAGHVASLHRLPPAPAPPMVVRVRNTTTLLTVDGTLVHQDQLVLEHPASELRVQLPRGATLWSATVDGIAVRPAEEGGTVRIPLGLAGGESRVELVAVQLKAVPAGRSRLELAAPSLELPVLTHTWSLLLPERNRYRLVASPLHRAPGGKRAMVAGFSAGEAGTSGARGTVVDEGDQPLPGVTVELSAPDRPRRTDVTDADGAFRVKGLVPGTYMIRVSLPGYQRVELENIPVPPGVVVTLAPLTLHSAFKEEILVTSQAPVVDVTSTTSGQTFSSQPPMGASAPRGNRAKSGPKQLKQQAFRQQLDVLKKNLVAGVRPVPVTLPTTGKQLLLTGALPPRQVTAVLEVKGRR